MPIPQTSIIAVKQFLLAAITTAVNDPAVLVCYGPPTTYFPDDIIFVGDVVRAVNPHAFVGSGQAGAFDEDYHIEVHMRAFKGGGAEQAQPADARGWQLAQIVDGAIRGDMSLGGLVLKGEPASQDGTLQFAPEHKGWECVVVMAVHCVAII